MLSFRTLSSPCLQALHRKSQALVCFTTPGGGDPTAALKAQQRDRLAEQTAFLERHSRELEATFEVRKPISLSIRFMDPETFFKPEKLK